MRISNQSKNFFAFAVILVLVVGLTLSTELNVMAKSKSSKAPKAPGTAVMVESVDTTGQQITILIQKDKSKVTYTVDDQTKITVDDKLGTLKDVRAGQEVYEYVERTSTSLDSIDVGPVKSKGK